MRAVVALAAPALAVGLALAPLGIVPASAAPPAGKSVPTTSAGAPQTIPGLATWTGAQGALTVNDSLAVDADKASTANAQLLAAGLTEKLGRTVQVGTTGQAGDVVLAEDASKLGTLGAEGYQLTISDRITVTGATDTGVFYGTQTVLQILSEGDQIPKGTSIDVPQYSERGIGICACQIHVSVESLEREMQEMAYLKLNQLLMEIKVDVPEATSLKANFWGYYTPAQAKELSDFAKKLHITLIAEVNSPGHMTPWLQNDPSLQLVDKNGNRDPDRLDITQPAALSTVESIISQYMQVFDTPYWHMGGDEYMLGTAYSNYPQFQQYIHDNPSIFPTGSTPTDVVIHFMNQVDDYVHSLGKTLRIWNDSILTGTKLSLNKDIVVEHWNAGGSMVTPQALVNQGHKVENSTDSLYIVRQNGNDQFTSNVQNLWNSNWTPRDFYNTAAPVNDDPASGGQVVGAKIMAWPDNAPAKTENQVETELFGANRFISQATWGSPRPVASYAGFTSLSDSLGHAPGFDSVDRTPVANGAYGLTADGASVTTTGAASATLTTGTTGTSLTFTQTPDAYYTITSPAGTCLTMQGGPLTLGAPLQQGLAATFASCSASSNLQKWQVRKTDGGFTVENAITLEPLVVSGGTLVQQAPDVQVPATFTFVGSLTASLTMPADIGLGTSVNATLTVFNGLASAVSGASAVLTLPQGWGTPDATVALGDIAAGGQATKTIPITVTRYAVPTRQTVTGVIQYTDGTGSAQTAQLSAATVVTCSTHSASPKTVVDVDSQEMDYEKTPGADAIDGNSNTFWGTQWYQADPTYPHEITVDLGAGASSCGFSYLPRQGGNMNGTIGKYEVYVSDSLTTGTGYPSSPNGVQVASGDPVASGTFTPDQTLKTVGFGKAVSGRYLTLKALSESGPNVPTNTTSVAELTVDPAGAAPATVTPKLGLDKASGAPGSTVAVSVTGAKPDWQYALQFHSDPVDLPSLRTDADGKAEVSVVVPAGAQAGAHQLVLLDGDTQVAQAGFVVAAAGDGGSAPGASGSNPAVDSNAAATVSRAYSALASTGSDIVVPLALGVMALLAGALVLVARIRRRARTGAESTPIDTDAR
ncbi:family 20 glycosylhydrolase [Humibacter antri]